MRGKIFFLFFCQWLAVAAFLGLLAFTFTAWMAHHPLLLPMAGGAILSLVWLVLTILLIRRSRLLMVYEVAWVLYPLLILTIPALTAMASWWMWEFIDRESYNPWLATFSGGLIAAFLLVRMFEIRYMPSVEDL